MSPRPQRLSAPSADVFAGIAARGASLVREALVEPQPPPRPARCLRLKAGGAGAFRPAPKLDTPAKLARALAQSRRRHARFLSDLAPALPATRLEQPVRFADWRLEPARTWTRVALPHYGGPIGRATAWYRMAFRVTSAMQARGAIYACFGAVDYRAQVFVNGGLAGTHEGFFAPFEFEITRLVQPGANELLVRVDNDAICQGNRAWDDAREGDKLYAATGLGWDEPGLGWHHCPPGMGIPRPVFIEARSAVHVHDVFVRPLPEEDAAELWVEVVNTGTEPQPVSLEFRVDGQNFRSAPVPRRTVGLLPDAGPGVNYYRHRFSLPRARRWSPATPWLYRAQVFLTSGRSRDARSRPFGMRSFRIDETSEPRGRLLLNGQPVRLRGANTMGHEQQCVYRGDLAQLRDDLLLAKLANMNFLRLTQRPVEPEVYDLCDRLGVMTQTDLPLFAYLRRNQFCEAVRQTAEMERMVRGHACNVVNSFINEPFPAAWGDKSHRQLTRPELESFFEAAARAMWIENPDRCLKPVDGDYDPPGPGLPDNHCYAGWYNGHGLDLGKLHRGFWIPVKPGWLYACGEFGSEGLEREALMRARYPKAWLPVNRADEREWTPARIHKAQTGTHYHLWLERQHSMADWIAHSQAHQAWITRLMTEAFRRDARMVSFAIHLFIDAFPAGWMKTIMDCERQPKPAYFAYREALSPLMTSLRLDRTAWWGGETLDAEAWVCNDTPDIPAGAELRVQLEVGGRVVSSARHPARVLPDAPVCQGRVEAALPKVTQRTKARLQLALVRRDGRILHDTAQEVDVFPRSAPLSLGVTVPGRSGGTASRFARELGLGWGTDLWFVTDPAIWRKHRRGIEKAVWEGATLLLLELPPGEWEVAGSTLRFEEAGMSARHFVAREPEHPVAAGFETNDFRFWHDPGLDRVAPLLKTLFFADDTWTPILRTGQGGWGVPWTPALAAAEKPWGAGRVIVCQVTLSGRLVNPVAHEFALRLLDRK